MFYTFRGKIIVGLSLAFGASIIRNNFGIGKYFNLECVVNYGVRLFISQNNLNLGIVST